MRTAKDEIALRETELFQSRVRAGLSVWLGAAVLFVVSDFWLEADHSPVLQVARSANICALIAMFYVRKERSRRQLEVLALGLVFLGAGVLALSAAVMPDPTASLILFSVLVLGSSTVLPWRFDCQVAVVVFSCAALLCSVVFSTGGVAEFVSEPMLGVLVSMAASLFIARIFEAQRRATDDAMLSVARLVDELEDANRFQGEFLANMSHELRTPLNVIIGYCEMLADGALGSVNDEQAATIRHVSRAAQGQLDLISATLELSRTESGGPSVEHCEIDTEAFLGEIEREAGLVAGAAGLRFDWNSELSASSIHVDAVKVKMILKNLIDNAVKFTSEGGISVRTRPLGDGVEFQVADTGPGIPPEARETIFEAFRQHDSPETRGRGGVGIGLYIVKRLVDALGGTVELSSEMGQGTVFRIWIPIEAVLEDSVPPPSDPGCEIEEAVELSHLAAHRLAGSTRTH